MPKGLLQRACISAVVVSVMTGLLVGTPAGAQDPPPRGDAPAAREELVDRRTQSSKTFRNGDGTLTTTLFSGPVHYRGADGSWREISSEFVDARGGNFAVRNEAGGFDVAFKESLEDGFMRFGVDGTKFDFTLGGAARSIQRRRAHALSYDEAMRGVDLEYSLLPEGVKETLVLDGPNVPTTYRFTMTPTTDVPVHVLKAHNGSWDVYTGATGGAPAFTFAAPTVLESPAAGGDEEAASTPVPTDAPSPTPMTDGIQPSQPADPPTAAPEMATAAPSESPGAAEPQASPSEPAASPTAADLSSEAPSAAPGEPSDNQDHAPARGHETSARESQQNASLDVKPLGQGRFAIELSVDAQWLHDPERRFPVLLDPTITVPTSAEDASYAWLCGGCWANTDYRIYLGAGNQDVWRDAIRFDTAALPVGEIISADLRLWHDGGCLWNSVTCSTSNRNLELYKLTAPWNLTTTVSQMRFDPTMLSSYFLPAGTANVWLNWDATSTVRSWIGGRSPNHGFLLKQTDETMGTTGAITPFGWRHWERDHRPRLNVTYRDLPVTLERIETAHSNGAELKWSAYYSTTGEAFQKYEVHRSQTAGFHPSAATLVATVSDKGVTSFTDTTAAPNKRFHYRILTNGVHASNLQSVDLPADGEAVKFLQEDPYELGQDTYVYTDKNYEYCYSHGMRADLFVGHTSWSKMRPLLRFDLGSIPAGATVRSAKLSLHQEGSWLPYDPTTVTVHRVTRAWQQGATWPNGCGVPGATWYVTDGVNKWTTQGGDFDPTIEASITTDGSRVPRRDDFPVTSLATKWINGQAPNFGVLLKASSEAFAGDQRINYYSTDAYTLAPPELVRPTLEIRYVDGSRSRGPSVALTAPVAGQTVRGTSAVLEATATDDGRVDRVEFLVDGSVVATDTTAPYSATWNSNSVANGSKAFTARAYDEVGNVTTSAGVQASVANSALPAVSLTAPSSGATVSGLVSLAANASDDGTVTKVEFMFDGFKVGEDTVAPYTALWNTLNMAEPAYNGPHTVSAVAHDNHGQATTATIPVTVANSPGTKYKAGFSGSAIPQALMYQPPTCGTTGTSACTQQKAGVNVTVTNASSATWLESDVVLKYRWMLPDGTSAANGPDVVLGSDMGPTTSKTLAVQVEAPPLGAGVDRAQFTLRFDLYEKSTGSWFATRGNQPLEGSVTIHKTKATDQLGLERFYQYEAVPVGAGMTQLTNVASGNSLLRWSPFSSPGRGLSTVLDLTYNALEDKSESPVGNNFSLSISSLTRFGNPLDIHPNRADEIAGNTKRSVRFVDGDGTTHEFIGKQHTDGTIYWEEPPGVHLFLRKYSSTNFARTWALTRPDGVTFFYDDQGFPTSVEDRNGNKLTFTLENIPPAEDPGGVKRRITAVTDAAGVAGVANRTFNLDYYSKDEAKKPQIRGKVEKITDHNGSALVFDYYEDGNLLRLTQKGGLNADGTPLADRSFVFTYTTPAGGGPAIADPAARANPDAKTSQSTRLYSVRDPRGAETTFTYLGSGAGNDRWKLSAVTDRGGKATALSYDVATRTTTVTRPMARTYKYTFDAESKVTSIVNPKNETTSIAWTADRHVATVTEPTLKFTEYRYNANGYPTEVRDQLGHATLLEYENLAVLGDVGSADVRDSLPYWGVGRSIPHVSQLKKVTDPRGNFSSFTYDAKGNLKVARDEAGFDTLFDYDPANGNLTKVTDANGNPTTFSRYDVNGFPQEIRNGEGEATEFSYDADGLLRWLQTPTQAASAESLYNTFYFDYDSFHRLGRRSTPKSSSELTWSGLVFDPNDNVVTELWASPGTPGTIAGAAGSKTAFTYDPMDRATVIDGPRTAPPDEIDDLMRIAYDDAGRVTSVTAPRGVATAVADDFTTFYGYDPLDRTTTTTRYEVDGAGTRVQTRRTHYCYNDAGDLMSVTAPKANLGSVTCGTTIPFTTSYTYDDAHRLKTIKRPTLPPRSFWYDANGNVTQARNERNDDTFFEYDKRNMLETVREPFDGTRQIVTRYAYDPVGNLKRLVSPKAWDASPDTGTNKTNFTDYVTDYVYDKANRLTTVMLPRRGLEERHYVHRMYDDDGNVLKTSLPTSIAPPAVPGTWPVPDNLTTAVGYFRNGWIQSTNDGANPPTTYDYTPEGWQARRSISGTEAEEWKYHPDGLLKAHVDRRGNPVTYDYDGNGNVKRIVDGSGRTDNRDNLEIRVVYNGFDEPIEVRHQQQAQPDDDASWVFTTYGYDLNGNVSERVDDGSKATGVVRGRRHTFSYNEVDWLTAHRDWGKDNDCTDDQWVDSDYLPTGWQEFRVIKRAGATCTVSPDQPSWNVKQGTKWTYSKNGKLTQLVTRNGDPRPATPTGTMIESHNVTYFDSIDGKSLYMNGHRTTDDFSLNKANHPCAGSCKLQYLYDARDRLRTEKRTLFSGTSTATVKEKTWDLDSAGNILKETVPATATAPAITREFTYEGTRLKTLTAAGSTVRYLYDSHGNLDCIVKSGYPGGGCPPSGTDLVTDYDYDDFDRLEVFQSLGGDGIVDDTTHYVYDVLDRVELEKETHPGFKRNTTFSYVGLTGLVATEVHDDPTSSTATAKDVTKSYSYDPFGLRLSLTNAPAVPGSPGVGKNGTFTYAYDVHGSVSALLDQAGSVEATYGYDAYGGTDTELSQGDKDPLLQLNAYRYTGKRTDVGSGTIDMGARRFSPDAARFLQPDVYQGALSNLGLSTDPLTGNRYALAAGNPVSFVEVDGHKLAAIGPGNARRSPGREAPGSINAAEGPVDHDAVKRAFFWDCTGMCPAAAQQAERYETSRTFAQSGLTMRCQEDCPDIRDSLLYKLALGDADNCLGGLSSMELRGSCVLALPIFGAADEAAAGAKGIYRAARGVENVDDLVDAGRTAGRVFDVHPRVIGQLADARLGSLAGRLTPDDLQWLVNNPGAQRFLDTRGSYDTINVIQEIEGRLIRITTPADSFRIISVGPIRSNQVANRIAAGDFFPLP